MTQYWGSRAEDFAQLRLREWKSNKHEQWLTEIEKYLPDRGQLKILDIGTGTGYFAFLLASKGHQVTGIDLTEEMIEEAKKTADLLQIQAEFCVMDAEEPEFAEEEFDVIVTRNLTWQLPHLEQAYSKWYGLLKKDGVLINFDADYCREQKVENLPEEHAHNHISQEQLNEYEHMKAELRDMQQPRPAWDMEILKTLGFEKIRIDRTVWQRIYAAQDEFYNPTPIFCLVGKK